MSDKPACRVVRAGEIFESKQGLPNAAGISAESVGATGLSLFLVKIPPGVRAKAHLHAGHETAIYVLAGEVAMRHGEGLAEVLTARAGDFVYIPAGVPHQPWNEGGEEAVAVIARTDPNEQESVVVLGESA